jgi:hypothetical protein
VEVGLGRHLLVDQGIAPNRVGQQVGDRQAQDDELLRDAARRLDGVDATGIEDVDLVAADVVDAVRVLVAVGPTIPDDLVTMLGLHAG